MSGVMITPPAFVHEGGIYCIGNSVPLRCKHLNGCLCLAFDEVLTSFTGKYERCEQCIKAESPIASVPGIPHCMHYEDCRDCGAYNDCSDSTKGGLENDN